MDEFGITTYRRTLPAADALAWARRRAEPIEVRCKDLGDVILCDNITSDDPRPSREVHVVIEPLPDGTAKAEVSVADN